MRVLTIIDHPNSASFTHAVAARFSDGARDAGHEVETADLHAEGFNPVWQMGDFAQDDGAPMPQDVLAQQARVERADALCLAFPLWWWGMPSVLKGWVDRVFSWGWAYTDLDATSPSRPLLRPRPCVLLVPAGVASEPTIQNGTHAAMLKLWDTGTLSHFGLSTRTHILYGATGSAERRDGHLDTAYGAGLYIGQDTSD